MAAVRRHARGVPWGSQTPLSTWSPMDDRHLHGHGRHLHARGVDRSSVEANSRRSAFSSRNRVRETVAAGHRLGGMASAHPFQRRPRKAKE